MKRAITTLAVILGAAAVCLAIIRPVTTGRAIEKTRAAWAVIAESSLEAPAQPNTPAMLNPKPAIPGEPSSTDSLAGRTGLLAASLARLDLDRPNLVARVRAAQVERDSLLVRAGDGANQDADVQAAVRVADALQSGLAEHDDRRSVVASQLAEAVRDVWLISEGLGPPDALDRLAADKSLSVASEAVTDMKARITALEVELKAVRRSEAKNEAAVAVERRKVEALGRDLDDTRKRLTESQSGEEAALREVKDMRHNMESAGREYESHLANRDAELHELRQAVKLGDAKLKVAESKIWQTESKLQHAEGRLAQAQIRVDTEFAARQEAETDLATAEQALAAARAEIDRRDRASTGKRSPWRRAPDPPPDRPATPPARVYRPGRAYVGSSGWTPDRSRAEGGSTHRFVLWEKGPPVQTAIGPLRLLDDDDGPGVEVLLGTWRGVLPLGVAVEFTRPGVSGSVTVTCVEKDLRGAGASFVIVEP